MLGWVKKDDLKREVDSFIDHVENLDIRAEIEEIGDTFPDEWKVNSEVTDYIVRYLSSTERLNNAVEEVNNYIKYLPEKL